MSQMAIQCSGVTRKLASFTNAYLYPVYTLMSPDSQRLEIEHLQGKLAQWRLQRPDFPDRIHSLVSIWLRPAMDSLDMHASQLISVIESTVDGQAVLKWLAEEAYGYSYQDTTLFDQYVQGSGCTDSGLQLRFLRRLTNSPTTLWRVTEKPNASSFVVAPASDTGPSHTIADRLLSQAVDKDDVLMTRLIDMPAGPILSQAVFNIGRIDQPFVDMSPARVQMLLSGLVSSIIKGPSAADAIAADEKSATASSRAQHPSPNKPQFTRHAEHPAEKIEHPDAPAAGNSDSGTSGTQERDKPADKQQTPLLQEGAERERLLDRVRKLSAMAQQSDASPHEAEIALRRCQSLMSKYGISEADLHTSEFGSAEFTKGRTIPSHVKFLASAVARLHDVLFVRGDGGFAEFRGFDVDAKVARLTLEYLIDAVERALAGRKRAGDFPAGRSAAYDYRLGFATQVSKRVSDIVEERKQTEQAAAGSGKSLTVKKMEIVDRECGHDLRNASFSSSRGARNGAAHAAGIDDGSRVSLNQQVDGSPAPLALPKT